MISGAWYACSLSSLLLSWAAEAEENPSGTANALMLQQELIGVSNMDGNSWK